METSTSSRSSIAITRDQLDLADSVHAFTHRYLTANATREAVGCIDSGGIEPLPTFWHELAAQGLLGLHVSEELGGSGAGLVEATVALEAMGRHLIPSGYAPTVLAAAVLDAAPGPTRTELLPQMVSGAAPAVVALDRPLSGVTLQTGALSVTGETAAYGGAHAALVILPVDTEKGEKWAVVDTESLTTRAALGIDMTRSTVILSAQQVVIPADRILDIDRKTVVSLASVIYGAEAVGVGAWCVDTATEYAKIRVQFGKPIGQFQGVKHRCARAAVAVEQARAAVWDAARALDSDDETADYAATVAQLLGPDAAVSASRDAMQVLGGIGYTWEHDVHLHYRRAIALRGVLGRSRDVATSVAQYALNGSFRAVEPELPPEAEAYRRQVRAELAEIAGLGERDLLRRLGDDGWVMPFLDAPLGRGAGPVEQVVIAQEQERAGIVSPQLGLAAWLMPSVAVHGTEEQKLELVRPTLRSEILWCQLFSEPEAGSDLASLRTEAKKVDGGWIVNGQKVWTSLGFMAEWGVLLARTNPDVPKHQGISYFLVDMRTQGVKAKALREASGGTLFSEVFFDDVFVPDSGLVGEVDRGWEVARGTLGNERVALGKGMPTDATVEDLLDFVRRTSSASAPLETVGRMVADAQTVALLQGRTLLKQLLGLDVGASASVAKLLGQQLGQQIADFCHAELGLAGVCDGTDKAARGWMEKTLSARPMTVYGGTTEVQLNVIGERILGLPRDSEPVR
ncbi:acyl-CoA dehydrogenase [Mycobacteroides chelonae]|uniref:acyl-CoA dehydrogenase n=1 Tax=Mycobacteroides chelonae TaxID=1774 RepID=UPI0039E9FEBC